LHKVYIYGLEKKPNHIYGFAEWSTGLLNFTPVHLDIYADCTGNAYIPEPLLKKYGSKIPKFKQIFTPTFRANPVAIICGVESTAYVHVLKE